MSNFELLLAESAIEEMEQLPYAAQLVVERAIDQLGRNPTRAGTRLKGVGSSDRPLYATRVGRYRVIYSVDRGLHTVTVVKITPRVELTLQI